MNVRHCHFVSFMLSTKSDDKIFILGINHLHVAGRHETYDNQKMNKKCKKKMLKRRRRRQNSRRRRMRNERRRGSFAHTRHHIYHLFEILLLLIIAFFLCRFFMVVVLNWVAFLFLQRLLIITKSLSSNWIFLVLCAHVYKCVLGAWWADAYQRTFSTRELIHR